MSRRPRVLVVVVVMLLWPAQPAQARSVVIPVSYLDHVTKARVLNELRPDACAAISIQTLVVRGASNPVSGGSQRDLILGGPNLDTINGAGANDCILGGGGIDTINGGPGTDVCIGGAGLDVITSCETTIQ